MKANSDSLLVSAADIQAIRLAISEHLDDLCSEEVTIAASVPQHVKGIHRQYVAAFRANARAKLRLSTVQSRIARSATDSTLTADETLSLHLESLSLRKKYEQLQIISRHASLAQTTSEDYDATTTSAVVSKQLFKPEMDRDDTSSLVEDFNELTRRLENDLININQQLKEERDQIMHLKSQMQDDSTFSNATKLQALDATRSTLTKWIDSSLTKCDNPKHLSLSPPHDLTPSDDSAQIDINNQYDRYIEARRKLLSLASCTSQPLIATTTNEKSKMKQPERVPQRDLILLQLQNSLLQLLSFSTNIKRHKTFLDHNISDAMTQFDIDLSRLQQESLLLLSYPELPKSSTQIGESSVTEEIAPAHSDHVQQHLDRWLSAEKAATMSVNDMIDTQVRGSQISAHSIDSALTSIRSQDEAWDHLQATGNQWATSRSWTPN